MDYTHTHKHKNKHQSPFVAREDSSGLLDNPLECGIAIDVCGELAKRDNVNCEERFRVQQGQNGSGRSRWA